MSNLQICSIVTKILIYLNINFADSMNTCVSLIIIFLEIVDSQLERAKPMVIMIYAFCHLVISIATQIQSSTLTSIHTMIVMNIINMMNQDYLMDE